MWFGEYQGNAIGMFDPKTERITEWKVPTPWSAPYDAVAGRNGEAWTGSMLTDRVARLDIKSGQYTEYMLPRPTNIRRVYRRRFEEPRHALDRQQPRRIDRQGRADRIVAVGAGTQTPAPHRGTIPPAKCGSLIRKILEPSLAEPMMRRW